MTLTTPGNVYAPSGNMFRDALSFSKCLVATGRGGIKAAFGAAMAGKSSCPKHYRYSANGMKRFPCVCCASGVGRTLACTKIRSGVGCCSLGPGLSIKVTVSVLKIKCIGTPFRCRTGGPSNGAGCGYGHVRPLDVSDKTGTVMCFCVGGAFTKGLVVPRAGVIALCKAVDHSAPISCSRPVTSICVQNSVSTPRDYRVGGLRPICFSFGRVPTTSFSSIIKDTMAARGVAGAIAVRYRGLKVLGASSVDASFCTARPGASGSVIMASGSGIKVGVCSGGGGRVGIGNNRLPASVNGSAICNRGSNDMAFSTTPTDLAKTHPTPKRFATATAVAIRVIHW